MSRIEQAKTYKQSIEIIPADITNQGIYFIQKGVLDLVLSLREEEKSISIIPIEKGGHTLGKYACNPGGGVYLRPNPMQMSHYGPNNKYLGEAICLSDPKISKIINTETNQTNHVGFIEAVVETQETILKAMTRINTLFDMYNDEHGTEYVYPEYHTFALASKIDGDPCIIPNYIWAFNVVKDIWLHGVGCDDEKMGRKKKSFYGRLSPKATKLPQEPYYTQNF